MQSNKIRQARYENQNTSGGKFMTKIERYQFIDRMLNESFPLASCLILALLNFFAGAVLIGLQILCIIYQTPLFYISVGIWYGVFLIFNESIVVLLCFHRSCMVFLTSIAFHFIVIGFAVVVAIVVGIEILVSFLVYSNTDYIWLNYSIVSLVFKLKMFDLAKGSITIFPTSFYLFIFKREFHRYFQVFKSKNFYNRN